MTALASTGVILVMLLAGGWQGGRAIEKIWFPTYNGCEQALIQYEDALKRTKDYGTAFCLEVK